MEENITRKEYYNALEAYQICGEKHKSIDEKNPYIPFDVVSMLKLADLMEERYLTPQEVFNSCDSTHDGKVEI